MAIITEHMEMSTKDNMMPVQQVSSKMEHILISYVKMKEYTMLHIFICPRCYNYRIVSRKPNAVCFHCEDRLFRSDLDFVTYVDMSEQERERYKESFIKRMQAYRDRAEPMPEGHDYTNSVWE